MQEFEHVTKFMFFYIVWAPFRRLPSVGTLGSIGIIPFSLFWPDKQICVSRPTAGLCPYRRLKAKREGNCSRPLTLEQLSSRGVCLRPQCLTVVWAVFSPFRWAQSSELRQRKERAICMASASGTQFLRERRPTTGRPHRRCGPTFSGMPLKLVEFGF